jgi:alpha-tubulin suppressor-like RCC1 family protein
MENPAFTLVRQILTSPLFLTKTTLEQRAILEQVIETGEITREDVFYLINAVNDELTLQQDQDRVRVLLTSLDYNTFLKLVLDNNIEGRQLIALCNTSRKINDYCNRSFQLLNNQGVPIDKPQEQYLFRLLLDKMKVRIPFGKFPRNVYIERIVGGRVWGFGNNGNGALGFGNKSPKTFLTPTLNPNLREIIQISAGKGHSLCLDIHGKAWSFGSAYFFKLGLKFGETIDDTTFPHIMDVPTKVVQVSAGNNHSLCLDVNGKVWGFGDNQFGQLGVLRVVFHSIKPSSIPNLNDIIQISAGNNSSFFLDKQGRVWVCGENNFGRLGLGDNQNRNSPTMIPALENIIQISAGTGDHALCLDQQGRVWGFGSNKGGELGLGNNEDSYNTPIMIPSLENIVQVLAGVNESFCLDNQGRVWSFGIDLLGRLGLGDDLTSLNIPTLIPNLEQIIQISCGFYHTLCLDRQGRVWVFGSDIGGVGRLGTGYSVANTPTLIPNFDNIIQVNCGDDYSLCIGKA